MTAALTALIERELKAEPPPEARLIVERILARHGGNVRAVLFYGACRRSGIADGLLDFYVIVDRATAATATRAGAAAMSALPPTVVFDRLPADGDRPGVAAKIAFVTGRSFARRMRPGSLDGSFWARFCQPVSLLYVRNGKARADAVEAIAQACRTAAGHALALVPGGTGAAWEALFAFTYRTELRPEGRERPSAIYDRDSEWYDAVLTAVAGGGGIDGMDASLRPLPARLRLRIATGKCLTFLRLIKGAFTFEGAVDYAIWKIERHGGGTVRLSAWQRRHPVLASPVILTRLLRSGAIR